MSAREGRTIDPAMNSWLSIVPPVLAIVLAIGTRQVYVALFLGILSGSLIMVSGHPFAAMSDTLERLVMVFAEADNVRVIFFCSLVGSLMALVERSGGLDGFVDQLLRRNIIRTRRGAQMFALLLGFPLFVESNINALVKGAVARPVCDRWRVSREKLSLLVDTTDAACCMMIPLNGWGALIISLLSAQAVAEPVRVLALAIPLSFYLFLSIGVVMAAVLMGRDWGPMRAAERRAKEQGKPLRDGARPLMAEDVAGISSKPGIPRRARNMVLPMIAMVGMIPVGLYVTGSGRMLSGSGATAVLWGVSAAVLTSVFLSLGQRLLSLGEISELILKGIAGLVPLNVMLVLAYAIGGVCRDVGTGTYVAQVFSGLLPGWLLPAVVFFIACLVSFSTGSSWGTFAIMIPVAVPAAMALHVSLPLAVGAVLSGGVFGDHASILSDTTIVSAMAAVADLVDHFITQLPYTLVAAGLTAGLYLVTGLLGG